jgi:hypothetical protein
MVSGRFGCDGIDEGLGYRISSVNSGTGSCGRQSGLAAHGWARDLLRADDMDEKIGGLDRAAMLDDLLGGVSK